MNSEKEQTGTRSLSQDMSYTQRLFRHTYASQSEDAHFLEFRLLQRLSLAQLQNELARQKGDIWGNMEASEEDLRNLRKTLHEYGKISMSVAVPLCDLKVVLGTVLLLADSSQLLRRRRKPTLVPNSRLGLRESTSDSEQ